MNPAIPDSKLKGSISWETAGVLFLFLWGGVLRLRQYLTGRSLWVDEAMLALNIVERSFTGLFQPLAYDQGAPIGFLLVEKTFNLILGRNEFALRLFPLLAGLISLYLFYLLLRRITYGAGLWTALALFAFNPRLIYYSSEVKQYIVDVAVTIFLLWIAVPALKLGARKQDFVWLTVAGLLALWLSHPTLFVLAGIGLALLINALKRRDYVNLRWILRMGSLWILNMGFLYLLILKDLSRNVYMREYWQGAFMPIPPWSDPGWFGRAIDSNIRMQFSMPSTTFLVFILMLAGWVILFLRNRGYATAFACILLVTLIAAGLQLYPIFDRMALFLVPIGLVLLGMTMEALHRGLKRYPSVSVLSVLLLTGYLCYGSLVTSYQSFVDPKYFEHIRPTMEHLRDSRKEDDVLYVSYGALPAFRYYASFYGLENVQYEFGRREDYKTPQNILMQIEQFRGQPRVWILFSHVYEKEKFNEREFVLDYLDQNGKKRREFRVPGTSVFLYLYDLRN